MLKLKELYLKGFKNPDREVRITFSDEPITIIYGENGSGKTTLLEVIQAIFDGNLAFLVQKNIREFSITFSYDDVIYTLNVSCIEKTYLVNNDIETTQEILDEQFGLLNNSTSILFGINRGFVDFNQEFTINIHEQLLQLRNNQKLKSENLKILDNLIQETSFKIDYNDLHEFHVTIDNLSVQVIEKTLLETFYEGQNAILRGISSAFFNTIDNALNPIPDFSLPSDFQERFTKRKIFFESFVDNLSNSQTKQKLQTFLETENQDVSQESPIFKALLKNMLESAEENEKENIDIKAVNTIVQTFNEFVIHQKKLNLSVVEVSIDFPNGQKHGLGELSSGERHLLSFLTIFLILGRGRNFFLIDEPEISLSVKWQRKLLSLLSEFSPESQIIVATHSPAIANRNYTNQVELV